MTIKITSCPIWGADYTAEGFFDEPTRTYHVDESPRAGGGYVISEVELNVKRPHFGSASKALLTTWLIDQRLQGNKQPTISPEVLNYAVNKPNLQVHERADRLLRYIAGESKAVGDNANINRDDLGAYAWSESIDWNEVNFYFRYLIDKGWLTGRQLPNVGYNVAVSVDGYNRISELFSRPDLAQAFVAMWFSPGMDEVYDHGIKPAIREAGYKPLRIDRKLDVQKIDDAIIAEIRRSRFLVADFTHGDEGVRGGVYFEAGFAMGLGIPVIFSCRNDMVTKLHFDTRQYAHIVWSTPEKLSFDLRDRILARIGTGPNSHDAAPLIERPPRKSLGQWLVDNVPRGTNLEPPSREDPGRPNPFLDGESL